MPNAKSNSHQDDGSAQEARSAGFRGEAGGSGPGSKWSNVIRQASGATLRIMCREEVGQSLQGRVRFLLRVRLQHGNSFDCSRSAFSARRRWLGIFAVAQLRRLPDKYVQTLVDPICGIAEGRSTAKIDRDIILRFRKRKSTYITFKSAGTSTWTHRSTFRPAMLGRGATPSCFSV